MRQPKLELLPSSFHGAERTRGWPDSLRQRESGRVLWHPHIPDNNDAAAEDIKVKLKLVPCQMIRKIKIRDTDLITDLFIYRRFPDEK